MRHTNRRGPIIKREIARTLRANMTPSEDRLWQALRRKTLGVRVRRQHPLRGFILDFFVPAHGLAIEVDGSVHDPVRDDARDAALLACGVRTLRFTNDEVARDLDTVVAAIRHAIGARHQAERPGPQ